MTRILIAVDGSKTSMKAIDYVVKRKRRGERVEAYILNVQPTISPKAGLITRGMIKDYQAQESEKALARPDLEPMKRYLQADTYVEIGDPATCIIAFAEKSKCEEIVVGSRGLGSVKGVFLGSVANKVIQISPIPVVVVK
jgi:nucleotide-binding universal stress UspA family protein